MSRSGGMQKQVNPKVAALLILVVLGVVQWAWWRGLVYQEPHWRMVVRHLRLDLCRQRRGRRGGR